MFRGISALSLDAKGRLLLPSKHHTVLLGQHAGRLVITADPTECLLVYPQAEWEPIEAKLMGLSSFNPQVRAVQRLLVGHAEEVEMDASGRILVSAPLRAFAGLSKKVVLVGQGQKFELWDEARWNAQRDLAIAMQQGEAGWPDELGGLSL